MTRIRLVCIGFDPIPIWLAFICGIRLAIVNYPRESRTFNEITRPLLSQTRQSSSQVYTATPVTERERERGGTIFFSIDDDFADSRNRFYRFQLFHSTSVWLFSIVSTILSSFVPSLSRWDFRCFVLTPRGLSQTWRTQIFLVHCCLRHKLFACLLFRRNARAVLYFGEGLLLHRGWNFPRSIVLITISRLTCVTVQYEIRGINYFGKWHNSGENCCIWLL